MQQPGQNASGKAQSENVILKAYEKKVKEDVRLMNENLHEMLKLLKMEDDKVIKVTYFMNLYLKFFDILKSFKISYKNYDDYNISKVAQADIDSLETQIRTSNIVKSTESLSKIISDLKDLTVLNDFRSLNSQITNGCAFLKKNEFEIDRHLTTTKDMLVKLLSDLQHEYYLSNYK